MVGLARTMLLMAEMSTEVPAAVPAKVPAPPSGREPQNLPRIGDLLNDEPIDPVELESKSFPIIRRGFDPAEVRAELQTAASEIRRLQRLCDELNGRLAESQTTARSETDVRRATEMLGLEISSVLEAAHDAATNRIERAESEAGEMNHEARAAAESLLAEASAESAELIAAARLEAEQVVEESRNHGRELVNEAQTVRERMLRDLARKRQTGRTQIEQLRAGRDRLLDALTTVQASLDTAIEDLVTSVPEARTAASRAGLRVSSEPTPSTADLEAEIEAGRLVGHPLVADADSPLPGPISDTFTTGEMEALDHLYALAAASGDTDVPASNYSAADLPDEPNGSDEAHLPDESDKADAADEDGSLGSAKDVFARLRSSTTTDDPQPDLAQETASVSAPESGPDSGLDSKSEAHKRAVEAAAKAMKKVLVEEQGSLLDGIRRSGVSAIDEFGESYDQDTKHNSVYDQAVIPVLREQCIALGGSSELDLTDALSNIHVIALEPVRRRLSVIAQQIEDAEELTDAVRALYREARSRHITDAASAVSVAVDGLVKIDKAHQNGAKGTVRWVVSADGPCGADCADNALAIDVLAGDEFPTGDRFPPAHPHCTCRLELA